MRTNIKSTHASAFLAVLLLSAGRLAAQHPGHAAHPLMHGQSLHLQVQFPASPATTGKGTSDSLRAAPPGTIDVPLKMVTTEAPQTLDQVIDLPEPRKDLAVRRFLPRATIEQDVKADSSGKGPAAIEVAIVGPKQSFRRWLIAGDPERNQLSSYIGTWRFMAAQSAADRDALWNQYINEFTRPPEVVVRGTTEAVQRVVAEPGRVYELADPPGKLSVLKFHPDCAIDRTTGEAINKSQRRKNPAVLLEIEKDGVKESRWIFAKFPGFAPAQGHLLPYQFTLDCPVEPAEGMPDFAIVTVADKTEVWTRSSDGTQSTKLTEAEKISVPGTSYQFHVAQRVPSAKVTETYKKDEKGKPALEIEYVASTGKPDKMWIELGHTRTVIGADGPILVSLQVREDRAKAGPHGGGHP